MPKKKVDDSKEIKLKYSPYEQFDELSRIERSLANRGLDEDLWKRQYKRYVEFAKANDAEYFDYIYWSLIQLNLFIFLPLDTDKGGLTLEGYKRYLNMSHEYQCSISTEEREELLERFAKYRDYHHTQNKPFYPAYYWFLSEAGLV